ncbi:methyltransferase domain-containing protein [Geomonas agri]|uniref:methyltransferase domain-containing protein n=1 Tax=Geomonas agri TaxID=2873702 RepID=UPI001CD26AB0|nr:methyltransferase domain-containing protein [Geomonas agri]
MSAIKAEHGINAAGEKEGLASISMVCNEHSLPLTVRDAPDPSMAKLGCDAGCLFPVVEGVPRFVGSEQYASSFGLQWKTFRSTQLDSCNGTTISRDRLQRLFGGDLSLLKGKNVLEAGCGAGRFTEIMLKEGANVFACDISSAVEANFDNCRNLQRGTNYFVCQADLRQLPLAPEQFDIVICIGVIQHTPDPEETMAALCRQVKPGGILVIDHYTYGYPVSRSREMLRKLLLQVPPQAALDFCTDLVDLYWPTHEFFWQNRGTPPFDRLRPSFLELSPIVDYHEAYPELGKELKTWALLDTHDTLTDTFKHLRDAASIKQQLESCGMGEVVTSEGGNGIEARAVKPLRRPPAEAPFLPPDRAQEKTRILIVAWGYSIHARRRIQVFTADPRFDVVVASNHDYNFAGARNVMLDGNSENTFNVDPDGEEVRFLSDYAQRLGVTNLEPFTKEICTGLHDYIILRDLVREFAPQVMLLQTLLYPCYLALTLGRNIPYLVTFWNGDVTWWAQYDGIEQRFKKEIVTQGALNAAAVTVNSEKAFQACLDYGVAPERIHLIRYPGADLARFCRRDQEEARVALAINNRKVVLCPRGLGAYLNADVIIEAAGLVCRAHPEVLFLFVSGVGMELWEEYLARGRELGIAEQLRHDGQVEWEKMPLYYNAADLMVSISSKDSLPNCMLEAMASHTPVLMGDIPPIRDWVSEGETGFFTPPTDHRVLAQRIVELLYGADEKVEKAVQKAAALVAAQANSAVNNARMLDLALSVAASGKAPAQAFAAPAP